MSCASNPGIDVAEKLTLVSAHSKRLTKPGHTPPLLHPKRKMRSQTVVKTKQKTETNITQAWGFTKTTGSFVDAIRIHTSPPIIWWKRASVREKERE